MCQVSQNHKANVQDFSTEAKTALEQHMDFVKALKDVVDSLTRI
jgi:hypothetical protein